MECLQLARVERARVSFVRAISLADVIVAVVTMCRVKYILNISREIDNFYPEEFKYLNIR